MTRVQLEFTRSAQMRPSPMDRLRAHDLRFDDPMP